jgi:hypothetical protein
MSSQEEAEAHYGHPLQYALVGSAYVGNTENLDDDAVYRLAGVRLPIERYNRCPTCEQWSPCDKRKV